MQRILIIGPCGAGKSTLAMNLAKKLGLPLYHMDKLNWASGWVEQGKQAISNQLADIVKGDRWLIDGNYGGTLPIRLKHADTILYLDFPIRLCTRQLLKRIWHYRGQTRPDMTEGCPERFDLAFLWYLLRWNAGPRLRTEEVLKGHEAKMIRLRSPSERDLWLAQLEEKVP